MRYGVSYTFSNFSGTLSRTTLLLGDHMRKLSYHPRTNFLNNKRNHRLRTPFPRVLLNTNLPLHPRTTFNRDTLLSTNTSSIQRTFIRLYRFFRYNLTNRLRLQRANILVLWRVKNRLMITRNLVTKPIIFHTICLNIIRNYVSPTMSRLHKLYTRIRCRLTRRIQLLRPRHRPHRIHRYLRLFTNMRTASTNIRPQRTRRIRHTRTKRRFVTSLSIRRPPRLKHVNVRGKGLRCTRNQLVLNRLTRKSTNGISTTMLRLLSSTLFNPRLPTTMSRSFSPPLHPLDRRINRNRDNLDNKVVLKLILNMTRSRLQTNMLFHLTTTRDTRHHANNRHRRATTKGRPPTRDPTSKSTFTFQPT